MIRAAFLIAIAAAPACAAAQPRALRMRGAVAGAQCSFSPGTSTPRFVGVSTFDVAITCPSGATTTAHVVQVDLSQAGLSFEASTGIGTTFQTELPTSFLTRTGSQIAFNANLFTGCCNYAASLSAQLHGMEIGGSQLYSPPSNNPDPAQQFPFSYSLVAAGGTLSIVPSQQVDAAAAVAAVSGSHLLVISGQNIAPTFAPTDEFFRANARTLVGLSATNGMFWVAAVDYGGASHGLTLPDAADLMISLGAATALNLDGGGSTSLAMAGSNGATLLNIPSDSADSCTFTVGTKCERFVGASFGIHAAPLSGGARGGAQGRAVAARPPRQGTHPFATR